MWQLQLCTPQVLSTIQHADSLAQNGAFIQNRAGTGSTLSRCAHGRPRGGSCRSELSVLALCGDGKPQARYVLTCSFPPESIISLSQNSDFLGQGEKEKPNLKDLVSGPSSNAALSILYEILGIQLSTYRKCQITIVFHHLTVKNDCRCFHWSTRATDLPQEAVCPGTTHNIHVRNPLIRMKLPLKTHRHNSASAVCMYVWQIQK